MMDFKFVEEIDDYAKDKVYLQIFDALGSLIKADSLVPDDRVKKNVEVARSYLEWTLKIRFMSYCLLPFC